MDPVQAVLEAIPALQPYAATIGIIYTCAVMTCSVLASRLPPPTADSSPLRKVMYRVVQVIAFNTGHAVNASDPKVTGEK